MRRSWLDEKGRRGQVEGRSEGKGKLIGGVDRKLCFPPSSSIYTFCCGKARLSQRLPLFPPRLSGVLQRSEGHPQAFMINVGPEGTGTEEAEREIEREALCIKASENG